eukprot:CAMPEP_0115148564 /NCGR_PEP_ID=MMETSP0227-20121206/63949_1 /TAXON_ID=89957 /ORGANISM="Polarella glacialis, Strain CCMP 1383" /LENGTH=124 /DNA_ID=CAMNT_0002558623 /DNA_START=57 /DNA_END=428 /DNA_ORIENTATION=-
MTRMELRIARYRAMKPSMPPPSRFPKANDAVFSSVHGPYLWLRPAPSSRPPLAMTNNKRLTLHSSTNVDTATSIQSAKFLQLPETGHLTARRQLGHVDDALVRPKPHRYLLQTMEASVVQCEPP